MSVVLIVNGPNLNKLGQREPEIYGRESLNDIEKNCIAHAETLGWAADFRQSNHEGVLVEWVQEALDGGFIGLLINAGAYTHTSLALHDALKMLEIPVIEVHLSDPQTREPFRHFSYISPLAASVIKGHGAKGYEMALDELDKILRA